LTVCSGYRDQSDKHNQEHGCLSIVSGFCFHGPSLFLRAGGLPGNLRVNEAHDAFCLTAFRIAPSLYKAKISGELAQEFLPFLGRRLNAPIVSDNS
jgi:hypothetical protein